MFFDTREKGSIHTLHDEFPGKHFCIGLVKDVIWDDKSQIIIKEQCGYIVLEFTYLLIHTQNTTKKLKKTKQFYVYGCVL